MADDHDALLARLDHPGRETHHGLSVLCKTAAAALRESQANYHAALDIIARLSEGWDPTAHGLHNGPTWIRAPILADEGEPLTAPMSDRQWAVYTHAAQRATGAGT